MTPATFSVSPATDGHTMVGRLLLRGMLVGLIAGILAFAFARVYGEPSVDLAIAFEEAMNAAAPTDPAAVEEEPLVSRATQAGAGLFTGLTVYATALGGLFALAFAFVQGRYSGLGPRGTAALIGLLGFVSLFLVPFLKYPSNPPAVGIDETIAARTQLYFMMVVLSFLGMVSAFAFARNLLPRHGPWFAALGGAALYGAAVVVASMALPPINEMPEGFSPLVVWDFRVATIGIHLTLWTTIALGFGWATERRVLPPFGRAATA